MTTPEPSAIVDAYAMLKTLCGRREDAVIRLVVNQAANAKQAEAVANKLARVSQQYLNRNLSFLGYVPRDPHVSQAVMQSKPFTMAYPNAPATRCVQLLADRLVHQQIAVEPSRDSFIKRFAQTLGIASNG